MGGRSKRGRRVGTPKESALTLRHRGEAFPGPEGGDPGPWRERDEQDQMDRVHFPGMLNPAQGGRRSPGSRLTLWLCREWPHCARTAGAEKDEPYEVRSWVRRPQSHLGAKRRNSPTFGTTENFLKLRASACVSQILHEESRCINQNIMVGGGQRPLDRGIGLRKLRNRRVPSTTTTPQRQAELCSWDAGSPSRVILHRTHMSQKTLKVPAAQ
ncbi:uncharacterized protein LOC107401124 isoform X2 [Peromyscus maniculatus bairdii]|uniref:uncharacterized protein LOC107401124 isoform X2 n=1 Tax=Peromyscus maniculatus bairdii TaxID=230844 RepID=UPI003FD1D94C